MATPASEVEATGGSGTPVSSGVAPPESFAVRDATLADAAGTAVVHVAAWQTTYRGQMPDR